MQSQPVLCPQCRSIVELRHDVARQDADDYTAAWVFVDHPVDEHTLCTASGQNLAAVHRHD